MRNKEKLQPWHRRCPVYWATSCGAITWQQRHRA